MRPFAIVLPIVSAILLTSPAIAEPLDEGGILNPEELTIQYYANNLDLVKRRHGYVCWLGYQAHKSADHKTAHRIFEACSKQGNHASMIFMSHLFDNGYGVEKDAEEATAWVRRAAKEGYSVGQFNYGVALLRGHGTPRDSEAAKIWIDRAAGQGDETATILIESGYDLDVVTPDAQEPDKQKMY